MRIPHAVLLALLALSGLAQSARAADEVTADVDPFLGIDGGGNTFPGPCMPFGLAKPGPDTGDGSGNAGWTATGEIHAFSQMHVSGTGGGVKYGNIGVMPTTGVITPAAGFASPRENERGSIGFYGVTLKRSGIKVEITAAERAARYRFTYPESQQANLIFNVSHCLTFGLKGENQSLTASAVTILSPTEVAGSQSVTGGWNLQRGNYTVYFYAQTDAPTTSWGTWRGQETFEGNRVEAMSDHTSTGGWLRFATRAGQQVNLTVGISLVSIAQARRNAQYILGQDFEQVRASLVNAWDLALGVVRIDGVSPERRQIFYTALYHTMLMPSNRTGENPLWTSSEPYYDDYYCIWDTFRTSSPLLTLIAERRQTEIVRALVDLYRHEGWMPDARSGNANGRTQGGSDGDIVVADAFVKGLKDIDWPTAYAALVQNAEVKPADHWREGRGGIDDWKQLGYLPIEAVDMPASRQMEYSANDFAVATLAQGLGKTADAAKYRKRAGHWENLWDADFTDEGFTGFIRSRHRDGSWKKDFTALQDCSWRGDTFYEGNSWIYSFFVPHDMARLIARCGGKETFIKRLDTYFDKGRFDVSNEPGFLSPYLYIWAGRHDRTAERVRGILTKHFQAGRGGIPGNDDSGAMSSLYAFGALGFMPVAGQDVYLIGSPLHESSSIRLANGATFTIEARGASDTNKYVTAATLHGQPLDRAWFRHADIAQGGTLVLTMASKPGQWPTGSPPPSMSDEHGRGRRQTADRNCRLPAALCRLSAYNDARDEPDPLPCSWRTLMMDRCWRRSLRSAVLFSCALALSVAGAGNPQAAADRGRAFRTEARIAQAVHLPRMVPRCQAGHLGALGTAVRAHVRRLVRPAHLRPGPPAVQGPPRTLRPPHQDRLQGHHPALEGREVGPRPPDGTLQKSRGEVLRQHGLAPRQLLPVELEAPQVERREHGTAPRRGRRLAEGRPETRPALRRLRAPRRQLHLVPGQPQVGQDRPPGRRAL